jgi:hypothetical protein
MAFVTHVTISNRCFLRDVTSKTRMPKGFVTDVTHVTPLRACTHFRNCAGTLRANLYTRKTPVTPVTSVTTRVSMRVCDVTRTLCQMSRASHQFLFTFFEKKKGGFLRQLTRHRLLVCSLNACLALIPGAQQPAKDGMVGKYVSTCGSGSWSVL